MKTDRDRLVDVLIRQHGSATSVTDARDYFLRSMESCVQISCGEWRNSAASLLKAIKNHASISGSMWTGLVPVIPPGLPLTASRSMTLRILAQTPTHTPPVASFTFPTSSSTASPAIQERGRDSRTRILPTSAPSRSPSSPASSTSPMTCAIWTTFASHSRSKESSCRRFLHRYAPLASPQLVLLGIWTVI